MKRSLALVAIGIVIVLLVATIATAEETLVSLKFGQGQWDPAQWTLCTNPGVDHLGGWVQGPDYIQNESPGNTQALEQTLTTMIYNTKLTGNFTASATFEIGAGSAPGIILAQDYAPNDKGRPQYGEFYEVIIYEKGLNLWHHFPGEHKPPYEKTSYSNFELKPDTHCTLTVKRQKQSVEMAVDGHIVGVLLNTLPEDLFIGVEGCEGISRVYDFSVTR